MPESRPPFGLQQRLRDCREQLAEKGSELAELQGLWDVATPEQSWSEAAFAQLKTELTDEQDKLARAEAHIEAARAAWTAARAVRSWSRFVPPLDPRWSSRGG